MCARKKHKEDRVDLERRGFRSRHDSRIFIEPHDLFHVFSGLDFSKLSSDKFFDRFEKDTKEDND
jgi:hypothetical protein